MLPALFRATILSLTVCATALPAAAQPTSWPEKPVRVIVPYGAGQGADVLMRLIANELQKGLGQPVVVENKAGAGGNIGMLAAAQSKPDGYTFLLGTNATNAANEFLYPNMGIKPASDFDAVALIGILPSVLTTTEPNLPTNGIAALVAQAHTQPGALSVGLPSTTAIVVLAQLNKSAQTKLQGVRYKASGQALTDLMGGQIPLLIDTVTASRPHIASGKLRALGLTSSKPSDVLPGVKPIAEQGVSGFNVVGWDGIFAPHGTSPDILKKMSTLLRQATEQPDTRRKMIEIGVEPLYLDSQAFDAFVKTERNVWGDIIRTNGIAID